MASRSPGMEIMGSVETRPCYPNVAREIRNVTLENIVIHGQRINADYESLRLSHTEGIILDGIPIA